MLTDREQYLSLALTFLTLPELDLRRLPAPRAQYLATRFGDWRFRAIALINRSWAPLGKHRLEFLKLLVPCCLELTLSGVAAISTQSRDWYFDLLLLEFSTTAAIARCETQTIDAVDSITTRLSAQAQAAASEEQASASAHLAQQYMHFFSHDLRQLLEAPEHAEARPMIALIEPFLGNIQVLSVCGFSL